MLRTAQQWHRSLLRATLAASLCLLTTTAAADALDWDPASPAVLHFTATRWSMIYPERDFEGGCVVGYLAFQFSPTGYFVFNNRVRGSWRIDEIGNLKLRTRDGQLFTLVEQSGGLRAIENVGFLRRSQLFAPCP